MAAGTAWDADRIRDTQVAQPLIVAASLLSWGALEDRSAFAGVAGHSVGEFAAAAAAGVLTEEDALRLVGIRGRAMAEAAAAEQTGMSAIIGGDEEAIVARLDELDLTPANYNGGGQLVAAGALPALQALAAEPPAGTRVIPLQVAGAFHTRYMAPAVDALRQAAATVAPGDPGRHRLVQPRRGERRVRRRVPRSACRPGRLPRAVGPLHGILLRATASPGSSNCRPPERSSVSPSARFEACRASQSRRPTTFPPRRRS